MDTLFQDLRYAVRTLVKNPGFGALTIVCLALGIGVNSTIFSVADVVAIKPLPFKQPETLVSLVTTRPSVGIERGGVSYPDVRDWKERTRSFETIAAVSQRNFTLTDRDEAERFLGAIVTADLFPMLGIQPMLGRQFRPEEDEPDGEPVVLVSEGVWQRRYAGDPSMGLAWRAAGGRRHRMRRRRGVRRHARGQEHALQRQRDRSTRLHPDRGIPRAGRRVRRLRSRSPRDHG
jgi:hypothetical protein